MPRWIFFILFLLAGFSVNVRAQEPVRTDTLPAAIKRASLLGRKTLSERVVIQKSGFRKVYPDAARRGHRLGRVVQLLRPWRKLKSSPEVDGNIRVYFYYSHENK